MTYWLRLHFVSLCLIVGTSVFSQPVFKLSVLNNVQPGQVVSPRVSVENFKNVLGAQFAILWDTTVLRFENISHQNMPNLNDTVNFSVSRVHRGILGFAWTSFNLFSGTTLADNTNIFRVNFTVVGPLSTGTALRFGSSYPTVFEIGQLVNGSTVSWTDSTNIFKNGFVAVGYTVSDKSPVLEQTGLKVVPNPFSDRARITYTVKTAAEVIWHIADPAGRIVLKGKETLPAGEHGMEIASTQLHGAGTYFFIAQSGANRLVQPFCVF